VALKIKEWDKTGCTGAVVGATYPDELKRIREILGEDVPILIPGVGMQGGDVKKTVENGTNKNGMMAVINSSRGVIYAGNDKDYAERSRDVALSTVNEINKYR
jgi:orotidine-5'-phosphate decarboxylase